MSVGLKLTSNIPGHAEKSKSFTLLTFWCSKNIFDYSNNSIRSHFTCFTCIMSNNPLTYHNLLKFLSIFGQFSSWNDYASELFLTGSLFEIDCINLKYIFNYSESMSKTNFLVFWENFNVGLFFCHFWKSWIISDQLSKLFKKPCFDRKCFLTHSGSISAKKL